MYDLVGAALYVISSVPPLPPSQWPLAAAAFLGTCLGDQPGEVAQRLHTLQRVDPSRSNYYEHLLQSAQ